MHELLSNKKISIIFIISIFIEKDEWRSKINEVGDLQFLLFARGKGPNFNDVIIWHGGSKILQKICDLRKVIALN